jgi:DNA-binding LacI/PurR family transcriptional regulator/ABC-type nitrate/sulfonate/bicarbonate transport system substrate-binding protein
MVMKRATMRDVAQAAGVSLMTVSRVVNGEAGVQPETAARVERAIRQLGYQRNDAARQLRRKGKPTQTIGLLVDDIANPFFATLARAVEDAARLHSFVVLIASSNDSLDREREILSAFSARRVDGVILVPSAGSHRFLRGQQELGVKVVCVDRPAENLEADTVVVDNQRGAYQAIRHLMQHGHQRIGYLGDREDIWAVRERFAGFTEALAEDGLLADPALVRHGLRGRAEAAEATVAVLRHPDPPTALFTSNDLVTMGAIDSMYGPGGISPVALVGFDEVALADKLRPPVTVVAQDPAAIGATAAQLLFARINGDASPARQVVLLTRLIARGSGEIPAPASCPDLCYLAAHFGVVRACEVRVWFARKVLMVLRRHVLPTALAVLAAGSVIAGCGTAGTTNTVTDSNAIPPGPTKPLELTNVTVNTAPTVDSAGLFVAKYMGLFKAAGLNVSITTSQNTEQVINDQALDTVDITAGNYVSYIEAQDNYDNGYLPSGNMDNPDWQQISSNLDIFAEASVMNPGYAGLFVLPDSPIKTIGDLKGAKIGINAQDNYAFLMVAAFLYENNIPVNDVTFEYYSFPDMQSALDSGHINVAFLAEPYVSEAEESGGLTELTNLDEGMTTNFPIEGYAVTKQWANEYPDTLKAFEHALEQGQEIADTNRATAEKALVAEIPGITPQYAALVTLDNYPVGQLVDATRIERVADDMKQFGLLSGSSFNAKSVLGGGPTNIP